MANGMQTTAPPQSRGVGIRFDELRDHFQGQLIDPEHPQYDEARRVWNGLIDRRPALIARCAGVADVRAAVRFAREREILVAVRGGGHNVAGSAVCDDGLVIDLSAMKGMRVDPAARTARAQPGLLWGEFDHETQSFGLATTGGIVTHTGIAGLTLGGGLGWLMRKHGLTCDNLLSADVVTAEGQFLQASAEENDDLFWALRGGGGNFGIVTSFQYRLHPVGPTLLAGPIVYPAAQAESVLHGYRDLVAHAPDELGSVVFLRHAPPLPWLPPAVHGAPVVIISLCYAGPLAEAERVVAPYRTLGQPLADALRPTAYVSHQGLLDAAVPHGLHYYWKTHFSDALSNDVISTLLAHAWQAQSPRSYTIIFHLGGAVSRVDEQTTAYGGRSAQYAININAAWAPEHPQHNADIAWTRHLWSALTPFATGTAYINFLDDEPQERVRAAYGPTKYQQLAALKQKHDPTNFFRLNQNIAPSPE